MKIMLLNFLLLVSLNCFSQQNEHEFTLYFGNDFDNDSVTIFVNGILVAQNIELRPRMISPKNLVIEQDDHNIIVRPYYGPKQTLKKIQIKNSILNLNIAMNNRWKTLSFDLKKGKYLFAAYNVFRFGWSGLRVFTIAQKSSGAIFM